MEVRSPISLELVSQGLVSGTREFKNAYSRELRKRHPEWQQRQNEQCKKLYRKKQKENPNWNKDRLNKWRKENPEKWKALARRASKNGIHKRHYARHKERIKEEKKQYGRKKRREDPTFGLRKAIADARKSGDLRELSEKLGDAIAK